MDEKTLRRELFGLPIVKHIILTGGTETAQAIAHAIMNACRSAFGNAGQKCSACSLLLVERSVYDSPEFME